MDEITIDAEIRVPNTGPFGHHGLINCDIIIDFNKVAKEISNFQDKNNKKPYQIKIVFDKSLGTLYGIPMVLGVR